jgi:hypothetical protein
MLPAAAIENAITKVNIPITIQSGHLPKMIITARVDLAPAPGPVQSEVSPPLSAATWAGLMPMGSAVPRSLNQAKRA